MQKSGPASPPSEFLNIWICLRTWRILPLRSEKYKPFYQLAVFTGLVEHRDRSRPTR